VIFTSLTPFLRHADCHSLKGESAISRQRWRKEVIDTKVDDFVDFANRLKSWTPSIAVVASQSALDEMERDIFLITV
jgi:hypothetical protein